MEIRTDECCENHGGLLKRYLPYTSDTRDFSQAHRWWQWKGGWKKGAAQNIPKALEIPPERRDRTVLLEFESTMNENACLRTLSL